MSKVTVAIPTYNRKEYLRECIESVLAQTFQDFTIAVFDNCSDYDVQAFLDGFNDSRVVLFPSAVNLGTYNRIFVYPFDSEYAVIFHDDDVMHPEMLEREVAAMDAHPELAWVGTGLRFIKDNASMRNFKDIKHADVFIYDAPGIVRLILKGFNLCYGSVMYRAVLIEPMDSFTPAYSKWADRPYLVSLSKKGKAGILKERLVNYRVHPGQDSQAVAPDSAQYAINLLLFYKKCLHDLQIASDRRLFYAYVVNSLVPAAIASSRTVAELKRFLEPHFRQNLVKLRYFNARGTARSLRALMRIVRKKLPWKN
ncbi:hypothetical protein A2333_01455 [Candidatus Wolfebacteria bacterium RIFOXYB2_FULL_49_7]|uniref:Glycosyltransferase 2-like domain-containing protein n=1 Tax=Candidatus Wolfebacteria bacterium RIFOXYB1_FULL_54_12 TaxID=1802559 RepID=A0A1F8DXU4_9BACT|nr:MAG: hypothetical protein A2372_02770 [Candidatus Wolfebacteria bacterium RIFOXYB1_FULL_54_12]OGM96025.1 MAG: hypothetical protein A2333_01455 [Candidatus Wolfebacteria bacterium RIFOXYB2_FULL_49_7]